MAECRALVSNWVSAPNLVAAAIVDLASGELLAGQGDPGFDLRAAARGNAAVLPAKVATLESLGLGDQVENIQFFLGRQLHVLQTARTSSGREVFVYLVLHHDGTDVDALLAHTLADVATVS